MLYIVRHGQTSNNKKKLLQGRSDNPLNEDGRAQSEEAGRKLRSLGVRPLRIYSSPLIRAIETAKLAADIIGGRDEPAGHDVSTSRDVSASRNDGEGISIDDRLIEMDYGPYEGMDLTDPAPEVIAFFQDFAGTPAPEGMEQLHEVVSRVGEVLEEIR